MRIRSWTAFGLLILLTLVGVPVYAQEVSDADLESCFVYYDYGNIRPHLATDKTSYQPGDKGRVIGTVVNENKFPVVDVTLFAHLKRVNDTSFDQNGHYPVDRLTLAQNLNFLPGETKGVDLTFPILPNYPNGKYQIAFFLLSSQGFHYTGRPFLEEDNAGTINFEISGGNQPEIYFDINSLRVNGSVHTIRELIKEYPAGPVNLSVNLVDNRETKTDLVVKVKFYSFDDSIEKNLVSEEGITHAAGTLTYRTQFDPPAPGAYVAIFEISEPVKTLLKYRFASIGDKSKELQMNDLGITNYPAGQDDRAFVCFHSPTRNNTPLTNVSLSLLDNDRQVVDQKNINGEFTGEIKAISLPLNQLSNKADFWIKALFTSEESGQNQEVEIHYDCNSFADSPVDLNINYSNDLDISATNTCGQLVREGTYIESIKVTQNGQVTKELYNIKTSKNKLALSQLPPGNYSVTVKSGKFTKTLDFKVDEKRPTGAGNWALAIIGILFVLGGVGYWYKMRKVQKK